MTADAKDARNRRAWEYPECTACESRVFVGTSHRKRYGYQCYLCDVRFNEVGA